MFVIVELQGLLKRQYPSEMRAQMKEGRRRKGHMPLPGEMGVERPLRRRLREVRMRAHLTRSSCGAVFFVMLLGVFVVIVVGLLARFVVSVMLPDIMPDLVTAFRITWSYAAAFVHTTDLCDLLDIFYWLF